MSLSRNSYKIILILVFSFFCQLYATNTINYNSRNGIVSNSVRKIFIDNTNRIWLGTDNGISVISSNGIRNIVFDKSWDNNQIWEIYQTPDSVILFGTVKSGLYVYEKKSV